MKQEVDVLFRKAQLAEVGPIWQIINQAKAQMRRMNSTQWDENYPSEETIRQDIINGNGYVFIHQETVVVYGVISFDGEEAYNNIEGNWEDGSPYIVVHRLAVADGFKRCGLATRFMLAAEEVARSKGIFNFRVDTKYDNVYMLRVINTVGFRYSGEVRYRKMEIRKAYEKTITRTRPQ